MVNSNKIRAVRIAGVTVYYTDTMYSIVDSNNRAIVPLGLIMKDLDLNINYFKVKNKTIKIKR